MAPLNPSLLFAVGVALDLIYESLKRRYPVEEGTGFGVEWVGWAILSAGCWTRSIVYRRTTTPSIDLGVEEDAASGRPSQRSGDLWPALALSPCLVGMGFLWQSEPERYNWILVGPHGRLVKEPRSSYVVAATCHYRGTSLLSGQTIAASGTR